MTRMRSSATVPSSAIRSCQPVGELSASRSSVNAAGWTRALRVWPPSNPILIFCGLSSGMSMDRLDDLGENPAGRGGMEKGYKGPADADARVFVDQPDAGRLECLERLLDGPHAVGDVM